MYQRKRYFFKNSIEVEESHTGKYGAPGMKRVKKVKATPDQIKKQNRWIREKKIRRIIKWNFEENDYWITLTYRKEERPPDMKEAQKNLQAYIRKIKRKYQKAGVELKWIAKTEIGSKGAVHHHLVMNRIPDGDKTISTSWGKGRAIITLLYDRGDYKDLAAYITKESQEEKLSRSRNMIVKEPEVRPMKRKTWSKDVRIPKGYALDKESLIEGINPVTGFLYRHYTLIKVKRRE